MDLITLLRAAITSGGGTPAFTDRVGLLQQLVATYGGDATKFTVTSLLREAIIARGKVPSQTTNVALLRELITTLGATPTTYAEAALTVQLAGLSIGGVVLPPAPAFTTQPSISPSSGTAGVTSFTATNGVASNAASYSRRWLLNGTAVSTAGFYLPSSAGSLVLEVTATGAGGTTIANSAAVTVAAAGVTPDPPVFSVVPTISGTPTEGETLTATTGTASNSPSYTLQWKRSGVNIAGATNTTYVLQAADVGSTITVTSTATNAGGSVSQTSTATATVAASAGGLDSSISAPTLTLATANTTYPPQFDIALDDTAAVGDVVRLQWKLGSSDFTSPTGDATNTIDAGEASAKAAAFTGLSLITTGTHRFRSRVERGASYGAWSNVVLQGPDDLAPSLSAPTITSIASTTATVGATTDEANGTLYYVLTTANTAPSAVQVEAGQNSAGTAAAASGSQAVSSTGAKTFSAGGLTASTPYYLWVMHKDAAGNRSTVLTGGTFTTLASSASVAKLSLGTGNADADGGGPLLAAGTDRSQYINCTDGYTASVNASTGAPNLVKSPDVPPSKHHFEATLTGFGTDGTIYAGVTDSGRAVGASVFSKPGTGGNGAGLTVAATIGATTVDVAHSGGESTIACGATIAAGHVIILDPDTTTNTVTVKYKAGGTTTTIGSFTMTSQIPTSYRAFAGGKNSGDVVTVNFGNAAWAVTPLTGHTGW